jgi:hypothetical protein
VPVRPPDRGATEGHAARHALDRLPPVPRRREGSSRSPRRVTRSWLLDMDGVLAHEEQATPVPTGSWRGCAGRSRAAIWTSALATARFLQEQRPGGTAFVIGEAGLCWGIVFGCM